jgi:hypothetical protein
MFAGVVRPAHATINQGMLDGRCAPGPPPDDMALAAPYPIRRPRVCHEASPDDVRVSYAR